MEKPPFTRILVGALVAAAIATAVNLAYVLAYGAATGLRSDFTQPGAVVASSAMPILLGGLAWFGLSRATRRAPGVMIALAVLLGIAAVVFGLVQTTLPDGTVKQPGFQGLVQPMHVVVPLAFSLVIPWWLRRADSK